MEFCCDEMREAIHHTCEAHPEIVDCPGALLCYVDKFDEYGIIITDDGASYLTISFCPWCGARLPDSKRDLWFETLEFLGYDNPAEQDVPRAFLTDEWYAKRN